MGPTDQEIAETIGRLAQGQFDPALDWPVCYELVRCEVMRRNLPARDYAPSSRFGGTNWTVDDFTEMADEWISLIRGERARRLAGGDRAIAHVANAARRSFYNFALGQARTTPRRDLWAALKEAMPDFISLTSGKPCPDRTVPNVQFPWQQTMERSARQRAVTASEVRAALQILQAQQPIGWSVDGLFDCIASWTGLAGTGEQSLDAIDRGDPSANEHQTEAVDSASIGREAAQALLRELDGDERAILRGFIVPNGLGTVVLEQAAKSLGTSKSTLHDRAVRLKAKLASTEHGEVATMDAAARRAFLDEILRPESGNQTTEPSIE